MNEQKIAQPSNYGRSLLTVDDAYKQAIEHFNAKRYTESDNFCTAIIQAVPNHIDAINLLGVIAQKLNRHDLAVEQFQKAINIDSNRALLYYNSGISLYSLGRIEESIEILKTALEKEPGNSQITNYLNSIADKKESTLKVSSQSHNEQEYLQKGIASHKLGQIDEAIYWYQKTLEINPENTAVLSNIGAAFQTSGKLDEAVASYQKAITIKPDYADAYYNLGVVLKEQEKLDEAVASYQKAITIKPDYADAYYNLGNALQEQGKLNEAVASY
jgi:tetratricopeptide (TPR) repeat protein